LVVKVITVEGSFYGMPEIPEREASAKKEDKKAILKINKNW